jgi:branched-chain amino acid transport system ATP-binding protein
MSTPAIDVRHVNKSFGNVPIIRDLNLSVVQGERHAIIGPNGAGKSTTFNLISGYIRPTSGEILLRDQVISGLPPYQINRRGLSRSFQVTNVFVNMSVWENVRCAVLWTTGHRYAFWKNIDRLPQVRDRTAQILEDIGLSARRDVPAGLLTYAEQRALEIGITTAGGADVILLDEPTAGMSHAETEARGRADPTPHRRPHAGDRRARHERGVRARRPHLGAGLRPDHRLGHARRDPQQSQGQGSLSRRGGRLMLEVRHLHAYYGKSHILQGVDMHVDAGEVVSLLGRNGVGRSTTVKAIMGEVPPQGSIRFKGQDIAGLPTYRIARLGLGYVPENRDIFPSLTVRQNLLMGIKDPRRPGQWKLDDMLGMFPNLAARADTAAGVLSGGEKQMLTICRTLMGNPDLVMIDEPTEGLAPLIVQQVGDLIGEIARRGVAILLVEQKLSIAMRISHRIYVMGHGRVVFEGTPDELKANDAVRKEWLEV